jgi:membrane protein YqaA with SNARE-associated domain
MLGRKQAAKVIIAVTSIGSELGGYISYCLWLPESLGEPYDFG